MNQLMLLNAQPEPSAVGSIAYWVITFAIFIGFFYFVILLPQKKENKRVTQMLSEMSEGDVVLTTSGFYGVIVDISDDDVIVEFGCNKNCRIVMRKSAIAQVEKKDA